MNPTELIHDRFVHSRRVRRLACWFAELLPRDASILDVGTGDGRLARLLLDQRPDLNIAGVEVLPRRDCAIPVSAFDGRQLPQADQSVDFIMFCDVLHHAEEPEHLLREAVRVARQGLVIKDHLREGWCAQATLRFMDDTGNRRHGVPVPAKYWTSNEWRQVFADLGLHAQRWETRLRLYPIPFDWWFGRSLHFLARLTRTT